LSFQLWIRKKVFKIKLIFHIYIEYILLYVWNPFFFLERFIKFILIIPSTIRMNRIFDPYHIKCKMSCKYMEEKNPKYIVKTGANVPCDSLFILFYLFIYLLWGWGIKLRVLHIVNRCSTIELHFQPYFSFISTIYSLKKLTNTEK
jgi:hypothetical protein